MDDIELFVVALDQAGVDEGVDGGREVVGDVVDGDPPAHPLPVVGDVDEAQHDVADALFAAGPLDGPGAQSLDGRGEAAEPGVAVGRERVADAVLPHLGERRRDERQGGIVAGDVVGHHVDQRRLDLQPVRRAGTSMIRRSSSSVGGPTSSWASSTSAARGGMAASDRVLVGANDDHRVDVEGGVEDEVEDPAGHGLGRAGGEDLLELVDDEQLRTRLVEPVDGIEDGDRIGAQGRSRWCATGRCRAAARCARAARARPERATTCRCPTRR